ncbi:uncharacterized protein LOC135222738 [Macrobrachium nipponense]|uniref:uncharacterized protein LOC135222738 n=1 Tax=Macrobrachium nipponense TaxID=159736 RepID=UPI0030C853E5
MIVLIAAVILTLRVNVAVTGMYTDTPTGCDIISLGKPDDEHWSSTHAFHDTIEATVQTQNYDWKEFGLSFESEDEHPIGYLQMRKRGNATDMTFRDWGPSESGPQSEKHQIPAQPKDLFVQWTTITLRRSNTSLHVTVGRTIEKTFTVNTAPFKFVSAYVPANQHIRVGFECKQGKSSIHNDPPPPETVTSDDLSASLLPSSTESEAGSQTGVAIVVIFLLLVAAATGTGCYFWRKKARLHSKNSAKDRQEDGIDGEAQALVSQNSQNSKTTQGPDTASIVQEPLDGNSDLNTRCHEVKEDIDTQITEEETNGKSKEDPNPECISGGLNENQEPQTANNNAQIVSDSQLQDLESQILPEQTPTSKLEGSYQNNLVDPIPEETPVSTAQDHTIDDSFDEVIDALTLLSINDEGTADNHKAGNDLGRNTEGHLGNSQDPQHESTSTNKQTIQGSLRNDHPENIGNAYGETAVYEEPMTRTLIRNMGENEGTVPTRLQEIQNTTNTPDTEEESPEMDDEDL